MPNSHEMKSKKTFRFDWIEFHGGFDQQVNIEATSILSAYKIFEKNVGFSPIGVTSLTVLSDTYLPEWIAKNVKVHFRE